jgi:hypothetical protein
MRFLDLLFIHDSRRGVARVIEKYRHKLYRRRVWGPLKPQWIQNKVLVRGRGEAIQQKW